MSNVTPLRRTAIIIRDMERSLQFYQQVLGLNIWVRGEGGVENRALYTLLGAPPCTVRYVILQSGKVDWGMVGLFELDAPAPPDDSHADPRRANRGEACLVFHTPDVRRIHRGARAMGLTVLCPPTRLVLAAHGIESLEMTLRDPNGVLLNFIQNVRGGIGPENVFPGLARPRRAARPGAARPGKAAAPAAGRGKAAGSRPAPRKQPGKAAAPARKPAARLKPRSGASRARRSG
jgi:catechol 2,3-dioxygenase-like lactoylglutathione lyase family enzyme